jgi:hypothetical protein
MNVETGQVGLGGTVISGAIAGLCGWTFAIPFDVVKNRHQVEIVLKRQFKTSSCIVKL